MNAQVNEPQIGQQTEQETQQENDPVDDSERDPASDFFERPAFFLGEYKEAYDLRREEVFDLLQPKNLFERLHASDIVNSIWEANRLRRITADIVTNARVMALTMLLAPFLNEQYDLATQVARDCYAGEKESKKKAMQHVRRARITNAQVSAQAYLMNSLSITVLDRGIRTREDLRRLLLKQHEKTLRRAEKTKRKQKQPINDAPPIAPEVPTDVSAAESAVSVTADATVPSSGDPPKRIIRRRVA
jgi:hypothetical protein